MSDELLPRGLHSLDGVKLMTLGKSTVTAGGLLTGLVIAIVALLAARAAAGGFRRLRERSPAAAPSIYIAEKLVTYGLVVVGFVMGSSAIGLDLSSLALFAGALGVGLGLGLQGVVKEFVSGLVLLFDRLVKIGDYIELPAGARGVVAEIGPRATRIRNNDDIDVLIPNSRLIEEPVINWTHNNKSRRFHIPFPVAYGVDKAAVREAVLEAIKKVPFTTPDTPDRHSQVWLVGFGNSSLNFELVVWPTMEAVRRPNAAQAAYAWAIDDALRAGGFEIPFDQVDLRIRSLFGHEGEAARDSLGLKTPGKAKAEAPAPAPAPNDAAEDLKRGAEHDAREAARAAGAPEGRK